MISNVLLFTAVLGQSLIQNGSFEDTASSHCPLSCILNDAKFAGITPWIVTSNNKEYEVDSHWDTNGSGKWSMDLNPNLPITIEQKINLVKGRKYTFSMKLNENRCGAAVKTLDVEIIGSDQAKRNFTHPPALNWVPVNIPFTAITNNGTVRIISTTGGGCGPVIDDIKVVQAPSKCNGKQ